MAAAVLELLLRGELAVTETLLWLRPPDQDVELSDKLLLYNSQQKDFVPYLLNFLREQTNQLIPNGPPTPAKTSSAKGLKPAVCFQDGNESGMAVRRISNSQTPKGPKAQLFPDTPNSSFNSSASFLSPSPSGSSFFSKSNNDLNSATSPVSPDLSSSTAQRSGERRLTQRANLGQFIVYTESQFQRRARKKNFVNAGRQGAKDSGKSPTEEDGMSWNASRRNTECINTSRTATQLNIHNLEEFPPVGATPLGSKTKPSRRINPTPVSTERLQSRPKKCFTSTPLSQPLSSMYSTEATSETFGASSEGFSPTVSPSNLQEEREMLKIERSKLIQQSPVVDPATPIKGQYGRSCSVISDSFVVCADVSKISHQRQLNVLAQLYSACISENLVPNIFLELFFLLQLLTSRRGTSVDDLVNDVEYAPETKFVDVQYFRSMHNCIYFAVKVLERQFTIFLPLWDENILHFPRTIRLLGENDRIGKFSPSLREQLTHAYEVSTAQVSPAVPSLIQSVPFEPETDNRSNFTSDKGFQNFKKQRDVFYELLREWEDKHSNPGWEFERAMGLRIRNMMINLSAACNHSHFARLFQKQVIRMCKGSVGAIRGSEHPDQDVLDMFGTDNLTKLKRLQERFVVPQNIGGPCPPPVFSGCQVFFRDFLLCAGSHQLNQHLSDTLCQILELDNITILRHKSSGGEADMDEQLNPDIPLIYIANVNDYLQHNDILLVRNIEDRTAEPRDYFEMIKCCSCSSNRCFVLTSEKKENYLNKLLILAVLGWLFQIPVVPEEIFFNEEKIDEFGTNVSDQALDSVPLVDQQLLYLCCPYLSELRKLLASYVVGNGIKNGGYMRKITPTSAEPVVPDSSQSQQKLQAELEEAFFHNQPPSLRKTVEFVAERVGSNCVKHIKATLVSELVRRGTAKLHSEMKDEESNLPKLLEAVTHQLCEEGRQSMAKGKEFCSRKGPEAIQVLLPGETSASVLRTAEDIATRLATEKACTWLSTNITVLIKKEMTLSFERLKKSRTVQSANATEVSGITGGCTPDCKHNAPSPSKVASEFKELLSVTLGPRNRDETVDHQELDSLLRRLSQTLKCRQYICPVIEQALAKYTVELASLLVAGEVPLSDPPEENDREEPSHYASVHQLLTLLLALWKDDFRVRVPLQLMFSEKNIAYTVRTGNRKSQWSKLSFLLHGLIMQGLMKAVEIERCWKDLSQLHWPQDFRSVIESALKMCSELPKTDKVEEQKANESRYIE
ncbi:codanin-1 [Amblyraja radiata]|uniref:codanin-1 n=1 Tax=Amblyraja radiata TaxID=386614 RepID=UPI00140317A5|nr:codanin-1 [Amblyraja radiata]